MLPLSESIKEWFPSATQGELLGQLLNSEFDAELFRQKIVHGVLNAEMNDEMCAALTKLLLRSEDKKFDEKTAVFSHFLGTVTRLPIDICSVIAQLTAPYITIEHVKDADYHLHPSDGTLSLNVNPRAEQLVILKDPCLPGKDNLPFQVNFDITFPTMPAACPFRHGGIVFGIHKPLSETRWNGHCSARNAKVGVIDWHGRKNWYGLRIYGVTHITRGTGFTEVQWCQNYLETLDTPPKKWSILFGLDGNCTFYADGVETARFKPVSYDGLIGFWTWKNSDMVVENLDIALL